MKNLFVKLLTGILLAAAVPASAQFAACPLSAWSKYGGPVGSQSAAHIKELQEGLWRSRSDILSSPRYVGPQGEKLIWANQDCNRAILEAAMVPGNVSGPKSAKEFMVGLTDKFAVDAFDVITGKHIPFDSMGRGLGRISVHVTPSVNGAGVITKTIDDNLEIFLSQNRITLHSPTWRNGSVNPFLGAQYAQAHLLRDVDFVFEDPALPGLQEMAVLLRNGAGGNIFHVNVTAQLKRGEGNRAAERILALECDTQQGGNSPFSGLKGVDVLTNRAAYNVALSATALASKFNDPLKISRLKDGIVDARSRGVPYKFVINGQLPANSTLNGYISDLNALLPPSIIPMQLSDFITMDIK